MKLVALSSALVIVGTSALVACGGSLASIPDEDPAPSATPTTTSSPPSTGNPGPTPLPPGPTPPPPAPVDGGPRPVDGGVPVGDASVPPADAGPAPGRITCGSTSCSATTQECCVVQSGATCIAKGGACQGGTFGCSSKASCTGADVCCGEVSLGGSGSTCKPSCGPVGIQLCAVDAECAPPTTCQPGLGGSKTCRRTFP